MEPAQIIGTLRARADEVHAICAGLNDEQLRRRPAENQWSLLEICCHLRDNASEEGARIRRMIAGDNPTLRPYDQDAWATERNYAGEDPQQVLTALRADWNGLVYLLEDLSDDDWSRPGAHPEAGAITVKPWAAAEVGHSAEHLEQMRVVRAVVRRP